MTTNPSTKPFEDAGSAITYGERLLAADARRNARNMRASCKLLALVLLVSCAMGAAAWAFLASLDLVSGAREQHRALFALLPPVLLATAWLYRTHGLQAGRGNNLVIDSALTGRLIHARMAFLTFFCSVATHLAGGSAGREGTAVQIGGTIASNVSHAFKLGERDHHDLMLSGISAAFGGVFGTPLAGAFFGMEMCYVGKLDYSSGLYCLIASFTGDAVSRMLGTRHALHVIGNIPSMSPQTILLVVLAAVAFGLTARLFSFSIRTIKRFYAHRFRNYLIAALVGSLVLLGSYAIFDGWRYGGLSEWMVSSAFEGACSPIDPIAKLAYTALTLGARLPRRRGHAAVWHRRVHGQRVWPSSGLRPLFSRRTGHDRRLWICPQRPHHHHHARYRPVWRTSGGLFCHRLLRKLPGRRAPRRVSRAAHRHAQAPLSCGR